MESHDLTLEQRKAIAIFAFQMMVADHTAVQSEHRRVDWLERQLGVDGAIVSADYFAEPDTALFPDTRSQLLLIAELYLVALADGHEHPDENALLRRLIDRFKLPAMALTALQTWAGLPSDARPSIFDAVRLS
jgi:uncharacterized tellurite resistance protein B-like protein